MLNSVEHEIFPANKSQVTNNCKLWWVSLLGVFQKTKDAKFRNADNQDIVAKYPRNTTVTTHSPSEAQIEGEIRNK